MQLLLSLHHGVFLDFTVWDNDSVYVLVTFVSIAFAVVLIGMVLHQTNMHESARRPLALKRPTAEATDNGENDAQ